MKNLGIHLFSDLNNLNLYIPIFFPTIRLFALCSPVFSIRLKTQDLASTCEEVMLNLILKDCSLIRFGYVYYTHSDIVTDIIFSRESVFLYMAHSE